MIQQWHEIMVAVPWGAVISASLAAAIIDVRSHRIPNILTFPLFVSGLVWCTIFGGYAGLIDSVVATLLLAFPFVLLWLRGSGGAGDAKMMGALGAWLGVSSGMVALVAVVTAGALFAIGVAVERGQLRPVLRRFLDASLLCLMALRIGKVARTKQVLGAEGQMIAMPYGVAIFAGVCIAATGVFLWPLQ